MMQGEIRPGYKKTDVGIIPEDWEVSDLSALATMKSGAGITSRSIDDHSEFPCYGGNGLRGYTDRHTHDGTYALIGRQGALCGNVVLARGRFFASEHAVVVTPKVKADIGWLSVVLREMGLGQYSESSAQPGLSTTKILKLLVAHPKEKNEQRAIAAALSDADALIAALAGMIAKKRDLKQAAMQHLLTGKARLPGFSGAWEVKQLADACWFQEGPGVRNTQFKKSGVKLLNGTNIYCGVLNLDTTNRFISPLEAYGAYSHFMADEGDIVLASSGITIERLHEKVAIVRAQDLPFCMNTSTIRFKANSAALMSEFLFHFLKSDEFKRPIGIQATGSAQLNFGPSHVAKIEISLPPQGEQTAIAEVLSDMDADLAALEARSAKACAVKQGMMQELLTGRVRLV